MAVGLKYDCCIEYFPAAVRGKRLECGEYVVAPVVPPVASGTRNPSLRSLLTKHKVLRRRGRGGERRDGVSDKGKGNDALTAAAPPPKQQLSILWSVKPSVHFSPILRIAEMFRALGPNEHQVGKGKLGI